jgi:hypothetical protein
MKRPSHSTVVSYLALFVALGGSTAYAANTIGSDDVIDESLLSQDIKDGEVKTSDLKNSSVTSLKINNGSVLNAEIASNAVTGSKIASGAVTTGKLGATSVTVSKLAPDALTRIDALPDVLPPGHTVRGTYGARQVADSATVASLDAEGISWELPMSQDPVYHVIPGGSAVPSGCSGSVASPGADPGHVCIFEGFSFNAEDPFLCNPSTVGCATRYGTVILTKAAAEGLWDSFGTWAATGI